MSEKTLEFSFYFETSIIFLLAKEMNTLLFERNYKAIKLNALKVLSTLPHSVKYSPRFINDFSSIIDI